MLKAPLQTLLGAHPMRNSTLSLYQYDALNRQVGRTPSQQPVIQQFHCNSRLATEIQGAVCWTIVQHDDQLLALHQSEGAAASATLLATDQQRSVLHARSGNQSSALAYTAYGHHSAQNGLLSLLGFNGERPDPVTGHYHLGNGYRQFSPVLMRFTCPDSLSPFGKGGLNAYGYCAGDPVNHSDPSGHWPTLKSVFSLKTLYIEMGGRSKVSPTTRQFFKTKIEYNGGISAIEKKAAQHEMSSTEYFLATTRAGSRTRVTELQIEIDIIAGRGSFSPSSDLDQLRTTLANYKLVIQDIEHSKILTGWDATFPERANPAPVSLTSAHSAPRQLDPPPSYQDVMNSRGITYPVVTRNRVIREA